MGADADERAYCLQVATFYPERAIASHARGRWFETSRAHQGKPCKAAGLCDTNRLRPAGAERSVRFLTTSLTTTRSICPSFTAPPTVAARRILVAPGCGSHARPLDQSSSLRA